ncbi:MAG: hypothetical protein LBR97_02145 [Dysgonamonadaceae bacterium]|jgi:hypothetical protein|nr:hypothetical protein [Dysgonamonadaceae bacterium]
MNKVVKALIAGIAVVCLSACSPMSKEAYLERFDEFVSEVSDNYKTYDSKAWAKQSEKYNKFLDEWYSKFKDEFTLKDEISIKANQAKWYYYRNLDDATSTVKQLLDAVDIKGMKQKVQYYIDNNMLDDLQKFYNDAQKAGKDAQVAAEEILNELNVKIEDLQK